MARKGQSNKSPPIGFELRGRIPEALSRVLEALSRLFCAAIEYLQLRISNANEQLRKAQKDEKGKETDGNSVLK